MFGPPRKSAAASAGSTRPPDESKRAAGVFFDRGSESREQIRRQVTNKADGVVDDYSRSREGAIAVSRVEGREHARPAARDSGQDIQQGGFAGVSCNPRSKPPALVGGAVPCAFTPGDPLGRQFFLETIDAIADAPPSVSSFVRRAATADAAGQTRKCRILADHQRGRIYFNCPT